MSSKIRLKNRLLPLLVLVLLMVYLVDPYRGWLVMLTGLVGMLLTGYIWVYTLKQNLRINHERRYGWAKVGDRLEERFVLQNTGWLPAVWVDVDYQTTMPNYLPGRAIGVPARQEILWVTEGICTQRGVFILGPLSLLTGDPLGVFQLEMVYPATTTLMVTPPILPLPKIRIAPGGRAGESRIRQHAFATSVSASNVREYLPGDSIRLIHWPTTARKADLHVRVLENTPAGDWWIFLDLDQRFKAGQGFSSNEEHAVILAASLAEAGFRSGNAVGLVTQGQGVSWLAPHFGEAHHHQIMHSLALAHSGEITLSTLLDKARPAFRQNPSLILITSNSSRDWLKDLLPLVKRRIIPTVLFFDPSAYPGYSGAERQLNELMAVLEVEGVSHDVMDPAYFDRPEAQPGTQGRWIWRRSKSSKAVAVSTPANLPWREVEP